MSYHGHFEQSKEPKQPKRRGRKVILIILAVLLVLVVGAVSAAAIYYNRMMNKMNIIELPEDTYVYTEETETTAATETIDATEEETTEATTVETTRPPMTADDIVNVLVVGQSSRAGEESRMADTTMLVSINTYDGTVTLFSVLRDSYVKLPDYKGHVCGRAKFTVCYGLGYTWGGTAGAMEMTNLCIKNNFGIEVDYNVEVDFDTFRKVIDLLGGVRIELTQAEADYINGLGYEWLKVVEEGENRLFGYEALEYARMRKAEGDSDSDIKRTERQRKLLTALFGKLASKGITGIRDIAYEILPLIKTNMPEEKITECLMDVLPMMVDMTIESGTCPVQGYYWAEDKETPDGWASVLCFASGDQKALMMPITEGYAP